MFVTFGRCLTKNSSAIIQLEVSRPICVELYQENKELGRFMIRARGNSIAAGVVTKVRCALWGWGVGVPRSVATHVVPR